MVKIAIISDVHGNITALNAVLNDIKNRNINKIIFENFIFDAFAYFDDMLLLRVDENEEFAPIKDFTGIYNPDTAIEKYNTYYKKNNF